MAIEEKLDAQTKRLLENSLHYPLVVLRSDLQSLLGSHIKDTDQRHAEQKRNTRQIAEVRRAINILCKHDGVSDS